LSTVYTTVSISLSCSRPNLVRMSDFPLKVGDSDVKFKPP
jgi:hypothetical protein